MPCLDHLRSSTIVLPSEQLSQHVRCFEEIEGCSLRVESYTASQKSANSCDAYWGPLSLTTSSEMPYLVNRLLRTEMIVVEVVVESTATSRYLEIWSLTTMYVFSFNLNHLPGILRKRSGDQGLLVGVAFGCAMITRLNEFLYLVGDSRPPY